MGVTFTTIEAFGLPETAELLTRAFADYFVKIQLTEATLLQEKQLHSVDFAQSRVVQLDGDVVVAPKPDLKGDEEREVEAAVTSSRFATGFGH